VVFLTDTSIAHAQVRAYAERTTVPANTPFRIVVEISGKTSGTPPALPAVDGLISNNPPSASTSTQIQIIGGKSSILHTTQYVYLAQATRTGKMTIPPLTIEVDGQPQTTEPIVLTIIDNPSPHAANPYANPAASNSYQGQPPQSQEAGMSWEEAIFIESSVDKKEVFQGEPVTLTLNLWIVQLRGLRVGSQTGQGIELPKAEGFYVAGQPQETKLEQERNGHTYEVHQFRQVLYPTATGDARISEWRWDGVAAYGFDRRPYNLVCPAIDIKVNPLPQRPPNFNGAVGSFTLKAQLLQDQVIQGVPTKLIIRITGDGNPEAIGAPPTPNIPNAYVSDPEKEVAPAQGNNPFRVEKSFIYTITPLEAGDLTIPEVDFCYFDPSTATYKTETANAFTVHVLPSGESSGRTLLSSEQTAPSEPVSKVDVLSEDILPIVTEAGDFGPHKSSPLTLPLTAALPVVAYVGVLLFARRKNRFETDRAYARGYHAKAKCMKALKNVATAPEPAEALYHALTTFMADELDVNPNGMTSADAGRLLASQNVEPNIVETIVKILRACERARYASTRLSPDEIGALVKGSSNAAEQLEQAIKKGRRG